jgi:surface protein
MSYMFSGCALSNDLNINKLKTNNVKDMSYMFHNCVSLTSLDISNFDTSKTTKML